MSEWAYWRAMLAYVGNPEAKPKPSFADPHNPESGYYRHRNKAVAIWREKGGVVCLVTAPDGNWSKSNKPDQIGDSVFSYCCDKPISREAYQKFIDTKHWPEDIEPSKIDSRPTVNNPRSNGTGTEGESGTARGDQSRDDSASPPAGDNLPKAPDRAMAAELDDLVERAWAWLKEIGGKVRDKPEADKLANYGVAVAELEKRAEAAREAEKAPYLQAGRVIDGKWKVVTTKAGEVKASLKALLLPYLTEVRRKAEEEALKAEEARRKVEAERAAAIEAGRTPPPAPPLRGATPSKTVAGTQGKVSLKGRTVYDVVDLKAACAHLAGLESPPADLIETVRKAAAARIKLGYPVPGVEARTEDAVA